MFHAHWRNDNKNSFESADSAERAEHRPGNTSPDLFSSSKGATYYAFVHSWLIFTKMFTSCPNAISLRFRLIQVKQLDPNIAENWCKHSQEMLLTETNQKCHRSILHRLSRAASYRSLINIQSAVEITNIYSTREEKENQKTSYSHDYNASVVSDIIGSTWIP